MIIDELLRESGEALSARSVADVRIGLTYSAVLLDDGGCGVAGTVAEGSGTGCTRLAEAGELIGRNALDLARLATGPDPVASTVGMAAINAVVNRGGEAGPDLLDLLPVDGAQVGMIGFFGPYVKALRERARELHVFERKPGVAGVLPDWAAERILPDCDVVIITSLTLVNKTLDHLLELAQGEVAVLGPTTPMSSVLASFGVSHLLGAVVENARGVLEVVSQAGGTRRLWKSARKVYRDLRKTAE